jgi:probable HAF family extracellular repeat protein
MRLGETLILAALELVGCAQVIRATSFTFATIDVPGSNSTTAFGINNAGQISGTFHNSSGEHGFVDTGGIFTTIDVPFAVPFTTVVNGINDAGDVVGTYYGPGAFGFPQTLPFLDNNGVFITLSIPLGTGGHQPFDINNTNQVVGSYTDSFGSFLASFIYEDGLVTQIRYRPITWAYGINDAGQVVGFLDDQDGRHGFLFEHGTFARIDVPGAQRTILYGINNAGQIVGMFTDGSGQQHSFLDSGGVFTPIDIPGGNSVVASGINDAGQIVGSFADSGGNSHGFLASPEAPEAASLVLFASGLAGIAALGMKRRVHL